MNGLSLSTELNSLLYNIAKSSLSHPQIRSDSIYFHLKAIDRQYVASGNMKRFTSNAPSNSYYFPRMNVISIELDLNVIKIEALTFSNDKGDATRPTSSVRLFVSVGDWTHPEITSISILVKLERANKTIHKAQIDRPVNPVGFEQTRGSRAMSERSQRTSPRVYVTPVV